MTSFGRGDMVGRAYVLVTADTRQADRQIKELADRQKAYDQEIRNTQDRLRAEGTNLSRRDIRSLANTAVRENERVEQERRRELEKTLKEFRRGISSASGDMGKLFGKGSRNDFLNAFGSFAALPAKVVKSMVDTFDSGFKQIQGLMNIFSQGGAGKGFQALGSMAAQGAIGLGGLAASAMGLVLALGPMAAGLSLAAGAMTAFAGSIGIGLVGGLAALGPAALAGAAGLSVLFIAFAHWKKTATDADKETVKPITDAWKEMQATVRKNVFGDIAKEVPILKKAMGPFIDMLNNTAKEMNNFGNAAAVMFSDEGSKNLKSYKDLMKGLPTITAAWGKATLSAGGAFVGVMAAALPIALKLATKVGDLAERFNTWANSLRGQNAMRDFFSRAYDDAQKIFTIISELTKAIAFLFDVGDKQAGSSFLDSWVTGLQKLNGWLRDNQATVEEWFNKSKEFAGGVGRAIQAFARIFDSLDTTKSRNQVIGLMDLLVVFFDFLNRGVQNVQGLDFGKLGESLTNLWTNIRVFLLPALGDLFGVLISNDSVTVFNGAIQLLADLMPPVASLISALADALGLVLDAWGHLNPEVQTFLITMALILKLNAASFFVGLLAPTTALAGNMSRTNKAMFALAGTLGRLSAVAIVAATVIGALKIYDTFTKDSKDAQKALDRQKTSTEALTGAMKAAGGPTRDFFRNMADSIPQQDQQFLKNMGISVQEYVSAAEKGSTALEALKTKAIGNANENKNMARDAANPIIAKAFDDNLIKPLETATDSWNEYREAQMKAAAETTDAMKKIDAIREGMDVFSDSTRTAEDRTRGLQQALDAMGGSNLTVAQATSRAAEGSRQLAESFAKVGEDGIHMSDAFEGLSLTMIPTSKAFSIMDDQMTDQQRLFADSVRATFDAAGGYNNLGEANIQATQKAQQYTDDLKLQLTQMGLSEEQAQELIRQYGLVPENVHTLLKVNGKEEAVKDIDEVQKNLGILSETTATPQILLDTYTFDRALAGVEGDLARVNAVQSLAAFQNMMPGQPGMMTGGFIGDKPAIYRGHPLFERGLKEAVIPLELPLNRVNPQVRPMAAMLRGGGNMSSMGGSSGSTTNHNVTMNVYPNSADPKAVAQTMMNRLASGSRFAGPS